jgi:hypothetical protein
MRKYMKLTSFIRSYKLALSTVCERSHNWKKIYVCKIVLPDKDESNKVEFVFSPKPIIESSDIGMSVSIKVGSIYKMSMPSTDLLLSCVNNEIIMTNDLINKEDISKEYINKKEKINDSGRFLIILENLLSKLEESHNEEVQPSFFEPALIESDMIDSISFNFEDDLAIFSINESNIYTNGSLTLFSDNNK